MNCLGAVNRQSKRKSDTDTACISKATIFGVIKSYYIKYFADHDKNFK